MTDDIDEPPTPDERDALSRYGQDATPPPALREAVLAAARHHGLVKEPIMSRRINWMVAAAAAIAAFAGGIGLGSARTDNPKEKVVTPENVNAPQPTTPGPADDAAPRFALFLLEDARYQQPRGESALMDRIHEYGGWARSLKQTGRFVTGEKLSDEGRLCRKDNGAIAVTTGVSRGAEGALAGYFLIGAKSFEEALTIADGCPHLKYGGTVEVRRIES
jgi:hypothetical protein